MHISFTKHNPNISSSSKGVMEYLEKENYGREKELENFFDEVEELEENNFDEQLENQNKFFSNDENGADRFYNQKEATDIIDNNKSSRHKEDQSNFFMINVSPSKEELEHLKKIADTELKNKGIGEKERKILEQTEAGKKQLEIMKNDLMHQAMREYTREVMKSYAENFNRKVYVNPEKLPNQKEEKIINLETKNELAKQGIDKKNPEYDKKYQEVREQKAKEIEKDLSVRPMTEKDLVWFGKVEETRTYKANDKWVMSNKQTLKEIEKLNKVENPNNKIKEKIEALEKKLHKDRATGEIVREGLKKGGDQYHVHIIVSRYDNCPNKRFKGSMSPLANHKNSKMADKNSNVGFNRDNFFQKGERDFDVKFKYERSQKESYEHKNFEKKKFKKKEMSIPKKLENLSKNAGQKLLEPLKKEAMRNTGVNEISKLNIMNNVSAELGFRVPMSIPKTPLEASIKLIRSAIQKINDVSKGI